MTVSGEFGQLADELAKLGALRDSLVLTESEFDALKAKLLVRFGAVAEPGHQNPGIHEPQPQVQTEIFTATRPPSTIPPPPPVQPESRHRIAPAIAPLPADVAAAAVPQGLSDALRILLWCVVPASAFGVVAALSTLFKLQDIVIGGRIQSSSGSGAFEEFVGADKNLHTWGGFFIILGLATFIVLVCWSFKAHKATQELCHGVRRWSRGWTIGGWFIPLAQLFIPKMVLNEIERIALAPRSAPGVTGVEWRSTAVTAISWCWWIMLSIGLVVLRIGSTMGSSAASTLNQLRAGYILTVAGYALVGLSSICGALHFRSIARRLGPDGMLLKS